LTFLPTISVPAGFLSVLNTSPHTASMPLPPIV
jgi:hypothetical protein